MVAVSRSLVASRRAEARMSTPLAFAAAFGGYLVVAAVLSAVSPPHPVGIAALAAVAAVTGWFGGARGALSAGALGWFFYSGFVAHAYGQLGITGVKDLYVALALVGTAVAASTAHAAALRRARVSAVAVPTPRSASR